MIDFNTYKPIIKSWIDTETSLTSIRAEQNAPQPAKPYLTFRLSSSIQVHEDAIGAPNSSGVAIISGNREFTLEVQGFGSGVLQVLSILLDSRNKPTINEYFTDNNLVLYDAGVILNITDLEESEYTERGSVEFFFRIGSEINDTIGLIESTEISGLFLEPDLSTISVITLDLNTLTVL